MSKDEFGHQWLPCKERNIIDSDIVEKREGDCCGRILRTCMGFDNERLQCGRRIKLLGLGLPKTQATFRMIAFAV